MPGNPGTVRKLHQCTSEHEQIAWTCERLKQGGTINEVSLWLAGVERPTRLIGQAKAALRLEGLTVRSTMISVVDAAGDGHGVLSWRIAAQSASPDAN